jgi:Zn finger protein HypA/HybF involved in hydrogenase expression
MFRKRKLLIATKHQKEKVIAPILEKELGVCCFIDETFDTDTLGTFSGEVERELDPISTAREKCLRAMKQNGCDLGVASEGSFGPHPSMFFISADDEFLIFIDTKNNIEVVVREISTSTNFNGKYVQSQKELFDFAKQVDFPSHGLILRKSNDENKDIHKGITESEILKNSFDYFFSKYNSVYAETDMRAMYNPARMKVIEKATDKLVQKIKSTCPQCQMPGFGITDAKSGLKCNLCGSPTRSILSYIYICGHCGYRKEEIYPNKKTTEEPTFCDYCNP